MRLPENCRRLWWCLCLGGRTSDSRDTFNLGHGISSFYKTLYVNSLHRTLHRIFYKPLYVFPLHRALYRMGHPEYLNQPKYDTRDTFASIDHTTPIKHLHHSTLFPPHQITKRGLPLQETIPLLKQSVYRIISRHQSQVLPQHPQMCY